MDDPYAIEWPGPLIGGVYANSLAVWHSPYEFTLDFCVYDGSDADVAHFVGIARVRIPVGTVFEVMRKLNESMTGYEGQYGEIRPPRLPSDEG
jgi:hypothetical protein